MIDAATMAGLARIAARERDVAHAYEPGFVSESDDVATAPRAIRSADPLSVAAPPGAYFVTPGSAGAVRFTRDGTFGVVDGLLCGADGRPVLGFALGNRGTLAPLRVDAYDRALGRASGAANASRPARWRSRGFRPEPSPCGSTRRTLRHRRA